MEIPNKQLVNKLESIKTGRIVSNYYKDLKEIKRAEQRKRRISLRFPTVKHIYENERDC